MTTPDEEITGYGGQPKTGPNSATDTAKSTGSLQGTNNPSNAGQGSTSNQAPGSGSNSAGNVADDAKAKAHEAADQVKAQAHEAVDQVKAQGRTQFEGYRETAADQIERVAQSAKAAAKELEGEDTLGLSGYVSDMAQSMVQFSENLRGKSVDELFQDVNRVARNNPALFITGSIALGFGLTRFARASSKRAAQSDYGHQSASSGMSTGVSQSGTSSASHRGVSDRLNAGETGAMGTTGATSASSTSRSMSGTTPGLGAGSTSTGAGATKGADISSGLGVGADPSSGLASTTNRDGKGKDGGLFP